MYRRAPRGNQTHHLKRPTFVNCFTVLPAIFLDGCLALMVNEGSIWRVDFDGYLRDHLMSNLPLFWEVIIGQHAWVILRWKFSLNWSFNCSRIIGSLNTNLVNDSTWICFSTINWPIKSTSLRWTTSILIGNDWNQMMLTISIKRSLHYKKTFENTFWL